jgi:hypothetical protein
MSAPALFQSLGDWAWPAFIAFAIVCSLIGVALKRYEKRKGYKNLGDGL